MNMPKLPGAISLNDLDDSSPANSVSLTETMEDMMIDKKGRLPCCLFS